MLKEQKMKVLFDFEKLNNILKSFYDITTLRYSAVDAEYNVVCASCGASDFCTQINALPEGHSRCVQSDTLAAKATTINTRMQIYRCHAGVTEAVIPIIGDGEIVAYLFFGQILNSEESIKEQWLRAKQFLSWHPDPNSLEASFKKLNILNNSKIKACANILRACSAHIWLDGVVKTASLTDIQRIEAYIDTHIKDEITLDCMAEALDMCKTKLCNVAKQHNTTIMNIVRNKRIREAKKYLSETEYRIFEISEKVGIYDYNYFTKLFKIVEGITPRDYRSQIRADIYKYNNS